MAWLDLTNEIANEFGGLQSLDRHGWADAGVHITRKHVYDSHACLICTLPYPRRFQHQRYCSQFCKREALSRTRPELRTYAWRKTRARANPNTRDKSFQRRTIQCEVCKKSCQLPLGSHMRKYCSKFCAHEARKKKDLEAKRAAGRPKKAVKCIYCSKTIYNRAACRGAVCLAKKKQSA